MNEARGPGAGLEKSEPFNENVKLELSHDNENYTNAKTGSIMQQHSPSKANITQSHLSETDSKNYTNRGDESLVSPEKVRVRQKLVKTVHKIAVVESSITKSQTEAEIKSVTGDDTCLLENSLRSHEAILRNGDAQPIMNSNEKLLENLQPVDPQNYD